MTKKTVLITGSTSGIGSGIATAFVRAGYNIIFNGLESDGVAIAKKIAGEYNAAHLFFPANMLEPEAIRDMVFRAEKHFGVIDVLVNNAGIQYVSPVEDFPENAWNNIIAVNLTAAFHLTKAVWPAMKKQHFGRIINIASIHGLFASPFKSAYVAAKHGLIGFTKAAALEGAEQGITCNAICPGYVQTPLVEKQVETQVANLGTSREEVEKNFFLVKHAIKEFVSPEAIAALCLFLSSDAAKTVTGTAIPVDAGWSAQ